MVGCGCLEVRRVVCAIVGPYLPFCRYYNLPSWLMVFKLNRVYFSCMMALALSAVGFADETPPIFETDVQPIFAAKCGQCHSDNFRKGGLNLSSIEGVLQGGESGEPAIAKSLDDSVLWMMVEGGDMPPEGEPPLTEVELATIRRWIETGAASKAPAPTKKKELTQHDILPIVLLRCTACHGPRVQSGNLDLRTRESMLKGGKSGPAMVPGDPDASLMIQRVESEACPPKELLLKFFVRRPPASEVETLKEWIAAGAPEVDVAPDVATTDPDPLVSDRERQHWAFQPPKAPKGPCSIDGFISAKLKEKGLDFSPLADRDTLIRRAYFDLIGLPPSIEEWQRWRGSEDPQWFAKMVDYLLASPHYGERWGRFWLDLAGYADSEGGISSDPVRPVAWKYRDYVIDAFNKDKPYDRFLLEQLAGDELVDVANEPVITPEMVDNLIATGFLRMGIDETGSRTMNFVPERLKVISDAITVVSSGLMGLTMDCARCHSHKYDPIPHRDYYRFKAIFQGALDEHDWSSFQTRKFDLGTQEHRQAIAKINPPLEAELKKLQNRRKQAERDYYLELLGQHYPEQPVADKEDTIKALRVADNSRTLRQRTLVEKLQRAENLPDSEQPDSVLQARKLMGELDREIDRVRRRMVPPLTIRALWDLGRPSPTYILRRGEYDKPGPLVGPGVPSVLTDGRTPFDVQAPFPSGTPKTGRRLAFARWLVQEDNPVTARVMVNRIWHHHFGTGLVKTLDNFGVQGERPSHPELLDWLAVEFVRRGWSIKEMHRLMMNSRTYQQSSRVDDERAHIDPQNRLLSRMPMRRLDAESLRDSLLFVSGRLDETPGGIPDPVEVSREGQVTVVPTSRGGWRRSIYLQFRRTEIPSLLETFDYPQMGPNCIMRNVSTVAPQSLMLMNSQHVRELAAAFAKRVQTIAGEEDCVATVDAVYQLALSREPDERERGFGIQALEELSAHWGNRKQALETYCHTIFNSAAFLYVD